MSEKRTRSSKTASVVLDTNKPTIVSNKNVFFIDDKLLESAQDIKVDKLRHPGTELHAYFILSKNNRIYEILQFNQPHRSWLIDETVSSNGKCSITTPIDPMLFALYYLRKNCSEQAIPLKQIEDEEYPKTIQLIEDYLTDDMLSKIADRKGPSDYRAFKFNKDKALAWLAVKTKHIIKTLKLKGIHVSESAVSANYIKDELDEANENEYLQYAIGLIGNYLTVDLHKDLLEYFHIPEIVVPAKRKSMATKEEPNAKKIKVEGNLSILMSAPKEKKVTAKEKAMKKAASGTKSISSFFKK